MARNSAPKQLLERDLVISRPVLDLPEDFQYSDGQSARARSLAEIFVEPPTEFLMGIIRGDGDFGRLLKVIQSRTGWSRPNDLQSSIVEAFSLACTMEEICFPATKLKYRIGCTWSLELGRPGGSAQNLGLGLTQEELDSLGESFVPDSNLPFLKFSGETYERIDPAMAPAVLLGPVTCRVVSAEELAQIAQPTPALT